MKLAPIPQFSQELSTPAFLDILLGESNGWCFFRVISGHSSQEHTGRWSDVKDALSAANANGWNVYYTVNRCGPAGPRLEPPKELRAIYVDDDGDGTPLQKERFAAFCRDWPPSIVVSTSPGRAQYLWLTEPLPVDIQPKAGRHAHEWFGTDRGVIDFQRILRLPGFLNVKKHIKTGYLAYPERPMVRAIHQHEHRYTEAEIRAAFSVADPNISGTLSAITDKIERGTRSRTVPEGWKLKREAAHPEEYGSLILHNAMGRAPKGRIDKSEDRSLVLVTKFIAASDMLALFSTLDPDMPGNQWRSVIWGLKNAASAEPWAEELGELWSSLALQPWPQDFQRVWDQGDGRQPGPDWRTLLKLSTASELDAPRKRDLLKGLSALLESHPGPCYDIQAYEPSFKCTKEGTILATVKNLDILLSFCAVKPRYDAFRSCVTVDNDPLTDKIERTIGGIARMHGFAATGQLHHHLEECAMLDVYDSAKDFLNAQPEWDGIERLGLALHKHLGAEPTPLNAEMFSLWLMGAVRRQRRPGCQFPAMLVLQGPQGVGKSSFFRDLAGHAFFSSGINFATDERGLAEQTRHCIIVEIPELIGLSKRDREHVKNFISNEVSVSRAVYAYNTETIKRRFVLAGTTNSTAILKEQDNRRWWIARTSGDKTYRMNGEAFRAEVPQLWAEAIAKERALEKEDLALPPHLWKEIAEIHDQFRDFSSLHDTLKEIQHLNGVIVKEDLWTYAGYDRKAGKPRHGGLTGEMREYMEENGWLQKYRKINRQCVICYQRLNGDSENYVYKLEGGSFAIESKFEGKP